MLLCTGYNASSCSQCTLHQPCQNGGTCDDVADHGFTCQCAGTYVGTVCNLTDPCQPTSPCKNGTCYYVIDATESNVTSHCDCSFGYTGTHCEVSGSMRCWFERWELFPLKRLTRDQMTFMYFVADILYSKILFCVRKYRLLLFRQAKYLWLSS